MNLRQQIEQAINSANAENKSNTPDFILADFLMGCLDSFDRATRLRELWLNKDVASDQKTNHQT